MKTVTNSSNKIRSATTTRAASRVGSLVFLALGLAMTGGGLWYLRLKQQPTAGGVETSGSSGVLSENTARILAGLTAPIDVRFFAPADVSALPAALGGYVTRVESLLAEYKRVADGKVRVSQRDPQTDPAAKAAAGAAGVVPFASENGAIVYLGLTVGNGARVETIAPLAPEWEAALESDLSRAILRVTATTAAPTQRDNQTPAPPAPIDPAISEELLKVFPDLATRSLEDAAQVLRETALEEFKSAVLEMQAKVQIAQKTLVAARQNKSDTEQRAALKAYHQVQSEQDAKLKEIPARLQQRLTALQRLKDASAAPAPAQ
jgi:hypothetical protein